jgi:hypothetical protein
MDYRAANQNSYEGIIRLQKQLDFDQTKLIAKLDEMNLLSSLSFIEPSFKEKNITAMVKVPAKNINPPQVKEKEKEIISSPVIIKEEPPVIVSAPKVEFKASTEKQEAIVEAKKKKTAIIAKSATEKKQIPRTDPKPKEIPVKASTTAIRRTQPKPQINNAIVKASVMEKNVPPVSVAEKKTVATTLPVPFIKITPVIPTNTAADVDTRKTEIIRSVFFKSDSLVINLYDNGEIDGDTVSVVLNGKIILAREGLTAKAITKTIYITPEMGDSLQLVMYAENLGTLPPNTGLLTLQDGGDRYEIRFAGDFTKNSAIILRRRR